jgi:hypothetical protein
VNTINDDDSDSESVDENDNDQQNDDDVGANGGEANGSEGAAPVDNATNEKKKKNKDKNTPSFRESIWVCDCLMKLIIKGLQ